MRAGRREYACEATACTCLRLTPVYASLLSTVRRAITCPSPLLVSGGNQMWMNREPLCERCREEGQGIGDI